MGWLDNLIGNNNNTWTDSDGGYKYGSSFVTDNMMKNMSVADRMSLEKAGGSGGFNLGDVSLFGGTSSDGHGGIVKDNGVFGPAMSVFSAWNNYNTSQAEEELANKQFDFSQDKFWNNYLMQKDAYTRTANKNNAQLMKTAAYAGKTPEQQKAYGISLINNGQYDGAGIHEAAGGTTQIGSAAPSKYAPRTTGAPAQAGVVPKSALAKPAPKTPKKLTP